MLRFKIEVILEKEQFRKLSKFSFINGLNLESSPENLTVYIVNLHLR